MSVQPFAPPREDLEVIEHLDFDPNLPCECPAHAGSEPARFLIRSKCCPPPESSLCCARCWDHLGTYPFMKCLRCGRMFLRRDDCLRIVCEVRP